MAKVEIAYDKQFLLLSQCFRLSSAAHASVRVCKRKIVTSSPWKRNPFRDTIKVRILKILLKMELLLTMSNSSFSHNALKHVFKLIIFIFERFTMDILLLFLPSGHILNNMLEMNDNKQFCLTSRGQIYS